MPLLFTWSDLAYLALSIFLIAVGLTLALVFWRLAETFSRLSTFVRRTERELMPLLSNVGGTVERVNVQLDKVDVITDSAVDAVTSADSAVRTVSAVVRSPVRTLAGLAAGVSYGASSLKMHRNWRRAVDEGKQAATRRQRDLDEELGGGDQGV